MSKQDEIRLKYAGLIADAVTHMRNLLDYQDTVKDPKKVVFYNQEKDTADKVKEPRQLSVLEPTIYWRFPLIIQVMRMLSQDPAVAQDDRPYYYNEILTNAYPQILPHLNSAHAQYSIIYEKTFTQAQTNILTLYKFVSDSYVRPESVFHRYLSKLIDVNFDLI